MENKNILDEETLRNASGGVALGELDKRIESLFNSGKSILSTMEHNSTYNVGNEPESKLLDIKKAVMYGDMDKAKTACERFREYMISIDWGGLLNTRPFKEILEMYG